MLSLPAAISWFLVPGSTSPQISWEFSVHSWNSHRHHVHRRRLLTSRSIPKALAVSKQAGIAR